MQPTKKQLDEFKTIWKKEFGEEISDSEALKQSTKMVTLVKTIAEYLELKQQSKKELR